MDVRAAGGVGAFVLEDVVEGAPETGDFGHPVFVGDVEFAGDDFHGD